MTIPRWSPADLNEQRRIVRAIADRAERDRRQLVIARKSFAARVRKTLTSPAVLGGAFVVGFLLLRPGSGRRGASGAARLSARARRVAASVVWLTQLYRQFHSGLAVGSAIAARSRSTAEAPGRASPR
jgi:hypothetical protein